MPMKTLQSESGFTLIEALIAMVVLSIGIFSLYSMQINSIKGNSKASRLTTASTWNADQVEQIVSMKYSDTTLDDGNGTPFTTADGRYTLSLNVAEDVPMKNLKTIQVNVQDNRQVLSRPVTFTYIKNEFF